MGVTLTRPMGLVAHKRLNLLSGDIVKSSNFCSPALLKQILLSELAYGDE